MNYLEPRLAHVQHFTVSGLSERTCNKDEFNPQTAKLPQLWERFSNQPMPPQSTNKKNDNRVFGVYSNYDSDATGFYTVTAGREIENDVLSSEFNSITVQTGDYLVFENQGPMPQAIIETWQRIWQYFSSQAAFIRSYGTDFEVYQGAEQCAVYIGIINR